MSRPECFRLERRFAGRVFHPWGVHALQGAHNNSSERELRQIAVGRKAWLFVGSDDHAHAAANLFSLIASCRLHGLDPEVYLRDLIRVLAHWPRDRYLELAPRYWTRTRDRLIERELELPLGDLTVPPAEEQSAPG